ncbi:hypothetical protein BNJ_00285 [Kaumoebavirus]|uniref:hypothetical protein n=1 Tax=Kaumoebavirus TaxID=1859492 RepID=UPI0009C2787A|nr:hypothetical protein BNJ_00285 [Kaumoebavirus]ARA72108.1 hypothetical protein BNJ_00285 [Kaumoebavirus]
MSEEELPKLISVWEAKLAENVERAQKMGPPNRRDARKKLKRLTKELSPDFICDRFIEDENGELIDHRLADDIIKIFEWKASGKPKTEQIEKLFRMHSDLLRVII